MNPVRDILHERFPQAIAGRGEPKRPLAIGIKFEIAARCPDLRGKIGLALRDYTGGPTYHRECVEDAVRINLDGEPDGIVTANAARYHRGRLRHLEKKWARQDRERLGRQRTADAC